jgi:hypothetical protein
MTRQIDDQLSAKFQASALNFNDAIKKLYGKRYALDSEQAFSIQFAGISEDTMKDLMAQADLPQHIQTYIVQYENGLTGAEYNDRRFSYRVAFVRKTTNAKTAADKVVEFVPADSELGAAINQVFLKETKKNEIPPEHNSEADQGRRFYKIQHAGSHNSLAGERRQEREVSIRNTSRKRLVLV